MDNLLQAKVLSAQALVAALVVLVLNGCSTAAASLVTDAAILSDAEARSASYCTKTENGCDITVRRDKDGSWTAWVVPITLPAPDGRRYVGIDVDDMYFYGTTGVFKSALRGYK